ncbi:MAG: hypothetical protein HYU68_03290 [Bacteroidetes bacterium]|nr:hypothetical protein [Bacteroidota bacterium]
MKNRIINLFLIFIAIVSINVLGSVNFYQIINCDTISQLSLRVEKKTADFEFNPRYLPVEKNYLLSEFRENVEEETFEEDDFSHSHTFLSIFLKNSYESNSFKQTIYQIKQKLDNRELVSLFVLHHCWKIFLV